MLARHLRLARAAREEAPAFPGGRPAATQSVIASNQATLHALGIRGKLRVSHSGDADEVEADRLADDFVSGRPAPAQCPGCGDGAEISRTPAPARAAAGGSELAGGGRPLEHAVRAPYERFFRTNLSAVRVHAGAQAQRSAAAFHARAYAHGNDVVFAEGEFAPDRAEGRRLLAHELAHVVQHARHGTTARVARQPSVPPNPVLTPDEMFAIVTRERAWSFNRGGAPVIDPAGVGRGVGAASGGRRAGFSVFSVIQVTDAEGRPVALSYGEHVSYGEPHAEQRAVGALRQQIPELRDLRGGRMTVVLDQVPCPPGRSNCLGLLQGYARERGLRLEIYLPTRERMGGAGHVSPRTAAMSSMRTDVPSVSLSRYDPGGSPAPGGSGPPGGPPLAVPRVQSGPVRLTMARPPNPAMAKQLASALSSLGAQARRSAAFTARLRIYGATVGGLLGVLDMLQTLRTAQQMYTDGTMFPEVERNVAAIDSFAARMHEQVLDAIDAVPILALIVAIADAEEREDPATLFDIDDSLTGVARGFQEQGEILGSYGADMRRRAQALGYLAGLYGKLVQVPMGYSSAPNAQALAMHISLERLEGRVGSVAHRFEESAELCSVQGSNVEGLAEAANDKAWAIQWGRIAVAVSELDRERALDESIRRERRLSQLHAQLEALEGELAEPVCRQPDEILALQLRRDYLRHELEALRTGASAP